MARRLLAVAAAWIAGCGVAREGPLQRPDLDVLVVAPHSDDEAIGCAAVMRRAIAEGRRVGVVVVTAGDGFPEAAAALARKELHKLLPEDFVGLAGRRQRHSRDAMGKLGLDAADLVFLGYPDGGLMKMYRATDDTPFLQPHTLKTATYGVDLPDYHSRVHGRPAPYVRSALIDDLSGIIRERRPRVIYVTGASDGHADHQATFYFTRDAARAAGFRDVLWTFVVHGRAPEMAPGLRVTLTEGERKAKRSLLEGYQESVSPVHDLLAVTYAKPEELFWPVSLDAR